MSSNADSFAQCFDAIAIDSRRPVEFAPAEAAESEPPGFSLRDDAGGRFAIDAKTGVIKLLDGELLTTERGKIHNVRIRVVEPSGEPYELSVKLRLTGLVPQVVGADEHESLAIMARDLAESFSAEARERGAAAQPKAASHWPTLARFDQEQAPFGALCEAALAPALLSEGRFALEAPPPRPAAADACWAI